MILIFGETGQVARELARLDPAARRVGRDSLDLGELGHDGAELRDLIGQAAPTSVINAAAYTAVDRAEEEEALATRINGDAPSVMAQTCRALGIPLVHISTDYVLHGAGTTPFATDSPTAPLGAYGRSKLKGEDAVRQAEGVHAILRTSWVFSAHGSNFVKTMLRLGAERDSLNVVADQIGGPTPARAIAQACLVMADHLQSDPTKTGTYHFTGQPETSWAGFARAIMAEAGLECQINDIPTSGYPTPARRPLNSRLDCTGLSAFGLERPDWRVGLRDVIHQLKEPA